MAWSDAAIQDERAVNLISHGAALDTTVELLATPTIPPMARQPFSAAARRRRPRRATVPALRTGGFRLAGFWDHDWSFAHQASYAEECRRVVEECAAAALGSTGGDTQTCHS